MLTYLKVSDYALIEDIEVDFHEGLNVLTGETGAGKTVLIGAIGLLLGDRADSSMVRHGAGAASFSAAFDLGKAREAVRRLCGSEYLDEGERELILSRTVTREGKSRCSINGRLCPVSALADTGEKLLEVHGQNDHQALLSSGTHIEYLDRFAGEGHLENLNEYSRHYVKLTSLLSEERDSGGGSRELDREAELLEHEIAAIDAIDPGRGEIEALENQARKMRNSADLLELAGRIEVGLRGDGGNSPSVTELMAGAASDLRSMAAHDGSLDGNCERVESLLLEIEDVAADVNAYRQSIDADPVATAGVEARLSTLREMCRRYGGTLDAVLEHREKAEARLGIIKKKKERLGSIGSEIKRELAAVSTLAGKLSARRRDAASALEEEIAVEMAGLELEGACFEVSVTEDAARSAGDETKRYGPAGTDRVEFLFSPDKSNPARPLRRIASGGEMSRVMLALKIVLAAADSLPVLVFDEVDAGIGGETASRVGEKLYQLTAYHQVFCVTHIPKVSTYADWQYRVYKEARDGGAGTAIELLDGEGRVVELCRMLGDASGREVTRQHARDILDRAQEARSRL